MSKVFDKVLLVLVLLFAIGNTAFNYLTYNKVVSLEKHFGEIAKQTEHLEGVVTSYQNQEHPFKYLETSGVLGDNFISIDTSDGNHKNGENLLPKVNELVGEYLGAETKFRFRYGGFHDSNVYTYHLQGSDSFVEVQNGKVIGIRNTFSDKAPVLVHSNFAVPRMKELYKKVDGKLDPTDVYEIQPIKSENDSSYILKSIKTGKETTIELDK